MSLPTWMPHSFASAMRLEGCAVPPFSGGSIIRSTLPPFLRNARTSSVSCGRKSPVGPAMTSTVASAGIDPFCASWSLATSKLSSVSATLAPL